jgi:cyanophycinase
MTRGTLFLVGGKDGRKEDRVLIDRFARICGGASARVLVITSASETPKRHSREYSTAFHESGVRDVSIYHAEERASSDDAALLASLDQADGIYFSGGGQRRLISAMGDTRFHERLRQRHREGLHVGGTSAGASAMSSVMIAQGNGGKLIQHSSVTLSTGFGLLPEIIVDQHFQQRERFSRLIAAVLRNPAMLGFGLDERTAVQIDSDGRAEVFGTGALTVVDGSQLLGSDPADSFETSRPLAFAGMRLHVLTEGWRYELAARSAKPPG